MRDMSVSLFQEYWSRFSTKSNKERARYFSSLSRQAQRSLVHSFFSDGWHQLIVRNIVDKHLDVIKRKYNIDILDMRIKALKGRRFLVDKQIWDEIADLLLTYRDYYDSDLLFGGLDIQTWGKKKQFYLIKGS